METLTNTFEYNRSYVKSTFFKHCIVLEYTEKEMVNTSCIV